MTAIEPGRARRWRAVLTLDEVADPAHTARLMTHAFRHPLAVSDLSVQAHQDGTVTAVSTIDAPDVREAIHKAAGTTHALLGSAGRDEASRATLRLVEAQSATESDE